MIIKQTERKYMASAFLTDETEYLEVRLLPFMTPNENGTTEPSAIYYGMSFYGPNYFTDYSMAIPFEEINFFDQYGYYLSVVNWNISQHQNALREFLRDKGESDIYFYEKQISQGGVEYIGWQKLYINIVDFDPPIFTVSPSYMTTDSVSQNVTGNNSTVIKYISDVKLSFTAAAQNEKNLIGYTIKNGNHTFTSGVLENQKTVEVNEILTNVDNPTIYITLEDSEGFRTNDIEQISTFIEYFYPTCNLTIDNPHAATGTTQLTATGIAFNGSFGVSSNSITVQYRYKEIDSDIFSDWITMTTTRTNEKHSSSATVTGLDYKKQYVFQARVVDSVTTVITPDEMVHAASVFDWGRNSFRFNVPVNMKSDAVIEGVTNANNGLNIIGSLVANDNILNDAILSTVEAGSWTPICNACSRPESAYGNYMRIGNVVTINFYFNGVTDTFVYDNPLTFSGLPFSADSDYPYQSGGGFCSNYMKTSSTEVFTGWGIEYDCINGYTNKSTGSSVQETINGTKYTFYTGSASSHVLAGFIGQEIYASGTITYKISEY